MEEELAKPDDLSSVEREIIEARNEELSDLERLYAFHAEEYYDECIHRYLSKDETQVRVEGENNPVALESYNRLEVSDRDTLIVMPVLRDPWVIQRTPVQTDQTTPNETPRGGGKFSPHGRSSAYTITLTLNFSPGTV